MRNPASMNFAAPTCHPTRPPQHPQWPKLSQFFRMTKKILKKSAILPMDPVCCNYLLIIVVAIIIIIRAGPHQRCAEWLQQQQDLPDPTVINNLLFFLKSPVLRFFSAIYSGAQRKEHSTSSLDAATHFSGLTLFLCMLNYVLELVYNGTVDSKSKLVIKCSCYCWTVGI